MSQRRAPAVIIPGRFNPAQWEVQSDGKEIFLLLTEPSGTKRTVVMTADHAKRMGGALNQAANDCIRRRVLREGDFGGRA